MVQNTRAVAKIMSDSSSWSLQLGAWRGVWVRVHALFIAVAVFALFLSTSRPGEEAVEYGVLGIAILFLSVLAHELGHCFAAVRLGGNAEQIVIGPLGGMAPNEIPREAQPEWITALAGPLVNAVILLLTLPILFAAGLSASDLISPLQPVGLAEGAWWMVALKLAFWINWVMLVVNMLPAFPFDGARVLRGLLWPALDFRTAGQLAVRTLKLTALGLCILACFMRDALSAEVLAAWVPLVLLATLIYFSAQREGARLEEGDWDEELISYDFSQGYTSLDRTMEPQRRGGGSMKRWLEIRRELRQRRRQSQEQDEERQVDEILIRLHENGMQGLSAKERALLNRVSARYRNRQRN